MADKTVTVEVLQAHTSDGVLRPLGSQYNISEAVLEYLIQQGLVRAVTPPDEPHVPTRKK